MINIYVKEDTNDLEYIYEQNTDYEIVALDYETTSIMTIYKNLFTPSLFGDKKLFLIDNCKFLINKTDKLKKKEEEVFNDILNLDTQNIIIFLIHKPLNKTIPYIKENISKIKYVDNIKEEKEKMFLKKYQINITNSNLKFIKDNIREDLNYYNELLKLHLYLNKKEITEEHIKKHIKLKDNLNIFNFIEYIILKNEQKAKYYYEKILYEEDFTQEQILAIMYGQLKFFIQLKILKENFSTDNHIRSTLKTSPYRVKNSLKVIRNIDLEKLIQIHNNISKYDYLIKSGKTKEKDVIINFLISD